MKIYIQQTFLGAAAVSVYAGDNLLTTCGNQNVFAGGSYGRSSRCDEWALCYEGTADPNTMITVVAEIGMAQGGCSNAVGVLVSVDFSALKLRQIRIRMRHCHSKNCISLA